VVAAANRQCPGGDEALATLCQLYWLPLFTFVRRRCATFEEAEDLTQGFFAQLLAGNYLADATPSRGRFRAFLYTALDHFLSNQRDRARAQKRGGGKRLLSLDRTALDGSSAWEPSDPLTPQKLFDRQWASSLLAEVLRQLGRECADAGKSAQFEELKGFLAADAAAGQYIEAARRLAMSEGATRVSVHRLRRRYAELLRAEIGRTLTDPGEIEAELKALFAAFEG
jgi:RNA polymerase sigma-70 factor (ECF subfamily)